MGSALESNTHGPFSGSMSTFEIESFPESNVGDLLVCDEPGLDNISVGHSSVSVLCW